MSLSSSDSSLPRVPAIMDPRTIVEVALSAVIISHCFHLVLEKVTAVISGQIELTMVADDGELRRLNPSPVESDNSDLEANGAVFEYPVSNAKRPWWKGFGLGLSGRNWDSWLSSVQKYSTLGPCIFLGFHLANTSLIPLVTRSIPESESYVLFTREVYQASRIEHAMITAPVIAHVLSGMLRRILRQRRHARLFGIAPSKKLNSLQPGLQGKLGYALATLLGVHVIANRVVPLYVDGGSSNISLAYVSYGLQKAPWFMGLAYISLIGTTAWHLIGGSAFYCGWKDVIEWPEWKNTSRHLTKSDRKSSAIVERESRRRRRWLIVSTMATVLTVTWLAGLKMIGDNKSYASWEVAEWDKLYKSIPILGHVVTVASAMENAATRDVANIYSAPAQGQLVSHNGSLYQTVKEGGAFILTPQKQETKEEARGESAGHKGRRSGTRAHTVFYNPIQQFNRDLSVLAIRAFGEHVIAEKKKYLEKASRRQNLKHGVKRKRQDDQNENGQSSTAEISETLGVAEEQDASEAQRSAENAGAGVKSKTPNFSILDALSATGLRALRYAKEIPFATRIVANDLSGSAIAAIKLNITHNGVSHIVEPNKGDACSYMYKVAGNEASGTGKFDVIDLDPYGTAAPFMGAAVQAVSNGGLLCVTCTDAGVFASNGYPEKAFALYGGMTMKGPHSHEGGLRLILNAIATSAAKYGLAIEPLLSLSVDFYARVFVR
ncbi:RNA methyltransferase tRNA(m5U54)methyltransferase, partial [Ascosphaera aggregata]